MALTPQQIEEARQAIGLKASGSSQAPKDWSSRLENLKSIAAQTKDPRAGLATPDDQPAPQKPGFFKSLVQGVTSPFARAGVELYNTGSAVNKAIHGDVAGAQGELDKTRDLPYIGKTAPTLTNAERPGIRQGLDVAGQGIELGTDFAGVGATGDLVKGAAEQGTKQLIKTGAKEGAIIGATQGFGKSIQGNDQSIKKTLAETAVGGVAGGVIGGITGGITGILKGRPWSSVDEQTKKTWDLIQPKLTAKQQAAAVTEGRIASTGKLGTIEQVPKGTDLKMIEAAHPYVSGAKNEIEAVSNMQQGIQKEATSLRDGLKQSSATWSWKNLKGAVSSVDRPHLLSGDLEKSFDKTLSVVLDKAQDADKNLSGLLDVRQQFDQEVENQYPNLYNSETMTAMKQAVLKTRRAINDLIESRLPNGTTVDGISFKDSLQKQSLLYDAIDNASSKVGKPGTNAITRWTRANPIKTKVATTVAGATAAGEAAHKLGIIP